MNAYLVAKDWGVRDLAEATGIGSSTVHRVVHEMERLGMLSAVPGARRWTIGPELLHLVVGLGNRTELLEAARIHIAQAVESTSEAAYVSVYSPPRRKFFVAAMAYHRHPYRHVWSERLQTWAEVSVGSDGLAILAFLPDQEKMAILEELPTLVPSLRPVTKEALIENLALIQRRGFATSRGERYEGSLGASAPLLNSAHYPLGSFTISWPESRDRLGLADDYGRLAVNIAERISFALAKSPVAHLSETGQAA